MKYCSKCDTTKPIEYFSANKKSADGLDCRCRACAVVAAREWRLKNPTYDKVARASHYLTNRTSIRSKQRLGYYKNHEESKAKRRAYYAANKHSVLEKNRVYSKRRQQGLAGLPKPILPVTIHKARKRTFASAEEREAWIRHRNATYMREVMRKRPGMALAFSMRRAICKIFKDRGMRKRAATFELLGYTPDELICHMEKQFLRGMTWRNYGDWECDHIIPLSSFDLTSDHEIVRANALTNLRPLWKSQNRKKYAKRLHLI